MESDLLYIRTQLTVAQLTDYPSRRYALPHLFKARQPGPYGTRTTAKLAHGNGEPKSFFLRPLQWSGRCGMRPIDKHSVLLIECE